MRCNNCFGGVATGYCSGCLVGVFCGESCHQEHSCFKPFMLIGAGGKRTQEESDVEEKGPRQKLSKQRVDIFERAHEVYENARRKYEEMLRQQKTQVSLQKGQRAQQLRTDVMRAQAAVRAKKEGAEIALRNAQEALDSFQRELRADTQRRREVEMRYDFARESLRVLYKALPAKEKKEREREMPLYDLYEGVERLTLVSDIPDAETRVLCLPQYTYTSFTYVDDEGEEKEIFPRYYVETGMERCYDLDALSLYFLTQKTGKDPLSQEPFTGDELMQIKMQQEKRVHFIYKTMFQDAEVFEKYFPIYFRNYGKRLTTEAEFGELSRFVDSIVDDSVLIMALNTYQVALRYQKQLSLDKRSDISFWKALVVWVEGPTAAAQHQQPSSWREHVEQFGTKPIFMFTQPLQLLEGQASTTDYIYPRELSFESVARAFAFDARDFSNITLDGTTPLFYDKALFSLTLELKAPSVSLNKELFTYEETFFEDREYSKAISYATFKEVLTKFQNMLHPGYIYHFTVRLERYDNRPDFEVAPLMNPADTTILIPTDIRPYLSERIAFGKDPVYAEQWPQMLMEWKKRGYSNLVVMMQDAMGNPLNAYVNVIGLSYRASSPELMEEIVSMHVKQLKNHTKLPLVRVTFVLTKPLNDPAEYGLQYNVSLPSWEILTEEQKFDLFVNRSQKLLLTMGYNVLFLYANIRGTTENPDGFLGGFPELNVHKRVLFGGDVPDLFDQVQDYVELFTGCGINIKTTVSMELFYPSTTQVIFNGIPMASLREITFQWFKESFPQSGDNSSLFVGFGVNEPMKSYGDGKREAFAAIVYAIRNAVSKNHRQVHINVEWEDE